MRGKIFFAFAVVAIFLCLSFASARDFPDHYDDYVNDFTGLLTENKTVELRALFSDVRANTTAEVVLVVVNTTAPYTPAEYATDLLSRWGVGKEDKDNGLLILYAVTEKKIFAATGYGLEGILPDSKIGRLLDENYVPLRDSGDIVGGIVAFSEKVAAEIEANKEEVMSGQAAGKSGSGILPIILVVASFMLIVFVILYANTRKRAAKKTLPKENANIEVRTSYNVIGFLLIVAGFVAAATVSYGFLLLIVAFIANSILGARSARCVRDGLAMRHTGNSGNYSLYECANGHAGKILRNAHGGGFFAAGGGFGGGGFGGGGFGGGMSGGGGAGR